MLSLFIVLFVAQFISACDNNDKDKTTSPIQQKTQKYTKATTLKGKVSNKKGALYSGEIKVSDSQGKVVATTRLKKDNHYSVTIPAGTELPIILTYYPKENNDKDKLISVVIYTSITKYDISELTTLIAKNAKALGGYTHTNMVRAAGNTVGVPDSNKTSTGFRGDPTKQYGGWH